MAGTSATILFKLSDISDDTVTVEVVVPVLLEALYVMLVRAVPPRTAWNSLDAWLGSTRDNSLTYGLPIVCDESKSPKS
jgi:hypothetical protein